MAGTWPKPQAHYPKDRPDLSQTNGRPDLSPTTVKLGTYATGRPRDLSSRLSQTLEPKYKYDRIHRCNWANAQIWAGSQLDNFFLCIISIRVGV